MSEKRRKPSQILSAQQLDAIRQILTGRSLSAVAKNVGVSLRTVQRWMKKAEFARELREQRRIAFTGLISRIVGTGELSLSVLHRALGEGELSTQISVASKIIEWGIRYQSIEDLDQRISALEQQNENEEIDNDEEL